MTVFVNAIMYYKVANATHAVSNVDDYSGSARLLAATTLRNVLGTMTLGDILCNREAIAKEMKVKFNFLLVILDRDSIQLDSSSQSLTRARSPGASWWRGWR